jgi:hypothetical protein
MSAPHCRSGRDGVMRDVHVRVKSGQATIDATSSELVAAWD